jgi:septum site-determining protein MinD
MTILGITSAKGGVGSSILATNLSCALTRSGSVALVDVHPGAGVDDLLLDLTPRHTWEELLPVASEMKPRHFDLARSLHPSGLELYAAPERWDIEAPGESMDGYLRALGQRVEWVILDLPVGLAPFMEVSLALVQQMMLVTTADPVALRATKQLYGQLPEGIKDRTGMVLNQFTRRHPAKPRQLADGMGIELIATLPSDVRAVGYQVNFGQACVLDSRSGYGRAVSAFADRLSQNILKQTDHRGLDRIPAKESEPST